MKKRELKRIIREMELNNNAMASDIGQYKRDIEKLWTIVGDEPRYLPDVLQARMDELRRLRSDLAACMARLSEVDVSENEALREKVERLNAECDRIHADRVRLADGLRAVRPVVEAAGAWRDGWHGFPMGSSDEHDKALMSAVDAYRAPTHDTGLPLRAPGG